MSAISPIEYLVKSPSKLRLDQWLSESVMELSRSHIQKLIANGHVTVNDQVCTAKKRVVMMGDRICINLPEAKPLDLVAENIPLNVLYEDDHLIVINKSANMVVHPAPGHPSGTLVNALLFHCPTLPGIGDVQRPGIVHRLDKDTTGAMVVAKTHQAMQHLQHQIRTKTARREYLALAYGSPKADSGTVDEPIGRHPVERRKMAIVSTEKWGRHAITHWMVKERIGNYSLLHYQLETGRTHQIRVHSAHIGHPVIGDPLYTSGKSLGINLTGQALHAWQLTLDHPVTGDRTTHVAPLPEQFETLLSTLRVRYNAHRPS
ncbi:MAG: RluA family pseudouridine synthase [Merismopedia sp. SIO2A8]|nr:RluA family pseudouridine synthase [Merismopedia sp. SIO2A8]